MDFGFRLICKALGHASDATTRSAGSFKFSPQDQVQPGIVGEPGVGKTAIVGGRAQRIVALKKDAAGDIILLINVFYIVLGAGECEGSMDAANLIKLMLARGKLHLICRRGRGLLPATPACQRWRTLGQRHNFYPSRHPRERPNKRVE
ncbi:hypothetical protein BDK51DRAFT_38984 [Blyttiomyces helicus]|uniref:Uncharacterized protein n=1 Tax=Blyttiomyces helicus TaxID=388810 RepID=A0A4P9W8P5_9FUNG|nr:hypothetical protein BDK51DRAFT_38984 [Blyttiomyces helicus]|eukprot:RKO88734.1 hypothetical protein BDK51DRAFT_38984 [Blyttiomyces helicus]